MSDRPDLLVIGGGGPIGRAIARAAVGRSIVVAGRRGPMALDVGDSAMVEQRIADARPRAIIYLVHDRQAAPDRAVEDLGGVLRAATRWGVERFLFASSAAVYGDGGTRPFHEGAALAGASDYARTKIRSEEELVRAAEEGGPAVLSLRIFNVFGPGCDDGLVNRLAAGPPPRLLTTAAFVRDYVHVDDVAAAFLAGVDRPEVDGAVNIARGHGVDNIQLAAAVGAGAFEPVEATGVRSFSVADVSRARLELDWRARVDPLEALRRKGDRGD